MNVDETLVYEASLDEPYSESWWHTRTADELRQMMSAGIATNPAFDGASAEAERRARERLRADEAAERADANRKMRLRLKILGIFLLAGLLALFAALLLR